jgi:rRNA maturation RNase YbeY
MSTLLTCRSAIARPYARTLRADANALLRVLALQRSELSVMIVDDAAIRILNRDFRAKDKPTDVLSFPQLEEHDEAAVGARIPRLQTGVTTTTDAPPLALGDIVISIDTASRQAADLGVTVAARIRTLLIHGLLHLLGYDHERSPSEARRMFARERELAAQLPPLS